MVISHTVLFSKAWKCFLNVVSASRIVQPYPQQGQRASQCPDFLLCSKSPVLWSPCCLLWPQELLDPQGQALPGERECVNAGLRCVLSGTRKKENFLVPLGLSWLGFGTTRCSFKRANQLPKLSRAFDRHLPPGQTNRSLWSNPSPCVLQQSSAGWVAKEERSSARWSYAIFPSV